MSMVGDDVTDLLVHRLAAASIAEKMQADSRFYPSRPRPILSKLNHFPPSPN